MNEKTGLKLTGAFVEMKTLLHHLLDFIFPPFCLHCDSPLDEDTHVLCADCLKQMEIIDPLERCRYCFGQEVSSERGVCPSCLQQRPVWHQAASVFDHAGPARSLVAAMKNGNQPYLAKGMGAFMAAQFFRLDWPLPDVIIPVPTTFTRWMQRGYNPSWHLAKAFGDIIKRPVRQTLKRQSGDYSQTRLGWRQRKELSEESFTLSKRENVEDKTLLLIDDLIATGATAACSAQILLEGFPQNIYILTVCNEYKGIP